MYILIIAIVVLWIFSIVAFAKWRFYYASQKGVVLASVLNDRLTNLFLRGTAAIILLLIFYIMSR